MILKALLTGLTLGLSTAASAQIGIGASVSGNSSIYVPYEVNESFRFEAQFFHDNYTTQEQPSRDVKQSWDSDRYSFSLGLLGKKPIAENLMSYYGVRFGLTAYEHNYVYTDSGWNGDSRSSATKKTSTGIFFTPTLGGEYYFNQHFSAAVEVGYTIYNQDNEQGEYKNSSSGKGTTTDIVLRYRF